MKYTFLACLGLVLLLATSCKKNDSDSPSGNTLDSITLRKTADNSVEGGLKYRYDNGGNLTQFLVNNNLYLQLRYNSGNRLTAYTSTYPGNSVIVDTLIYAANGLAVQVYASPVQGGTGLLISKLTYDTRSRLTTDTTFNSLGIAITYVKYNYNSVDDLQSKAVYSGSYSSNNIVTYARQDSTVYTYDDHENPYYKSRAAIYYTGASNFALSRHNVTSIAIYQGTATQTNNAGPYEVSYYKLGQLRTQVYGSSSYVPTKYEFLYR